MLALLVVAGVVLAVAISVDSDSSSTPASTAPPRPQPVVFSPEVAPVGAAAPQPTAAGVTAAITPAVRAPALGTVTGQVADAITGEVLWSQDPARPVTPASTTKILTAAAALLTLPADQRLTTTVVVDAAGRAVLVGGGDPTISTRPIGADTLFTDAARIADLAAQIKKSGVRVTSLAVDTSRFTGPDFAPSWERADIAGGSIAPVQAVMTDSGRIQPTDISPRTPAPALAAGRALADALGLPDATVSTALAPAAARQIASVRSAPLMTRLRDMMVQSDDVLAETIAIEVAQATGGQPSLEGAATAVPSVLRGAGIDLTGVSLADTNGLSTDNRIPAVILDKLLLAAAGSGNAKLRPLLDLLPISGATGTLSERFAGSATSAAGWVRAKTGTLTGVNTLAGIVQTKDNRVLTFTLMSTGTSPDQARPALDTVVSRLRACGCR
ncbi:D-alanyl-D-alanine carboxypeptidase/D-alanyl-D-alanine-endopeptidase [Williamsia sp. CHRR-6]|uniref:D-alanyl-D-alanine carboxypeptidase/D-alanyl-D-alanine endopeptidase n=1 Tax=Williamsia sp. CHRR-6 TaxID=2835871 RepID=UPI0027DB4AC4|nr:D-alanyl-D-alanine carboxypeptidase/D-alanyl-D-alanine-endopeptidase [Williamsia sp. CHRR-6]